MSADFAAGVLLAGGRARRFGGEDKGLLPVCGKPLAERTLARLRPQTAEILVSANRNVDKYAELGRVVQDRHADFCGPLAGIYAGLCAAKTKWVLSVPCDSPFFPENLGEVLMAAAQKKESALAVAVAGGRSQPVFMLVKTALAEDLAAFLDGGGRKIDLWQARHSPAFAEFPDGGAFDNINTPEELAAAAQKFA